MEASQVAWKGVRHWQRFKVLGEVIGCQKGQDMSAKAFGSYVVLLREAVAAAPIGGDADPKLQVLRHYLRDVGLFEGVKTGLIGMAASRWAFAQASGTPLLGAKYIIL